jgi:hypothetical protein
VRKATILLALLVFLAGLAHATFVVTPAQDSFDVLQNSSVTRTYMVDNNDTAGAIEVSTSVGWVLAATDSLNISPGKTYTAKITFTPGMMKPGDYNVVLTFASKSDVKTVRAQVKVVRTDWVYTYLLPGESYTDITYVNTTIDNASYTLVLIKGSEAFLIRNGKDLVKDVTVIKQFYTAYYGTTLFPSASDLGQVNSFVKAFNDSRNVRVRYSGNFGAEDACKQLTGIGPLKQSMGRDVLTLESATLACQIVNAETLSACGDPTIVYGTLYFGTDVYNMDHNLSEYTHAMSNMTLENGLDNLLAAKGYIEKTKASASSAAASKLRWDSSCRDCVGACPVIPYNISALDSAISSLTSLYNKALPIKSLSSKPAELVSKTNDRISKVVGKEHKSGYAKRYEAIKPLADDLIEKVAASNANVFSPDLDRKFAGLINASATLQWIIDNGDYSDISKLDSLFDANVDKFYAAKGEVDAILKDTNGLYDSVYSVRQNASAYLVKAEMNVQPGDPSAAKIEELRSRMAEVDGNFTRPLKFEMASPLSDGYENIAEEAKKIADSKPSTSIVGRMISKIIRTEKFVALSFIGIFTPLTLSERTIVSEYIAPATALLILTVIALVFVLMLFVKILRNRRRLGRIRGEVMKLSLFGAATLIVALICVGAFYYLTTVYGSGVTLNLFTFEVQKANGAAVLVDENTASFSPAPDATKDLMRACGDQISQSLSQYGAKVYYVSGDNCTVNDTEKSYFSCEQEFAQLPIVYVRYGSKNGISFRILYAVNATLEGNDDWISACHLAKALR